MKQESNTPDVFREFAQRRLDNHIAELNTRYEELKIDKETLEKAYEEHRKTFEKELDDKIQSLNAGDTSDKLKDLKQEFVSRLK